MRDIDIAAWALVAAILVALFWILTSIGLAMLEEAALWR